jgi:hypothetical protein
VNSRFTRGSPAHPPQEERDPEEVWREVVRNRLQFATMLFGSWKFVSAHDLCVDHKFH